MRYRNPILSVIAIIVAGVILYQFSLFLVSLNASPAPIQHSNTVVSETPEAKIKPESEQTNVSWQTYTNPAGKFSIEYEASWVDANATEADSIADISQIEVAKAWKEVGKSNPSVQIYVIKPKDPNMYSILDKCDTQELSCVSINGKNFVTLNTSTSTNNYISSNGSVIYLLSVDKSLDEQSQSHIINSFKF